MLRKSDWDPQKPGIRDLRGNNIPIDRRAQALRPYSNGFCPQCRGELRSPKRYIIKAQVPYL